MKKTIIITNIPAVYRVEFYRHLYKNSNVKIYFYDLDSKELDYCKYKKQLDFFWEKTGNLSLFFQLMKEKPDQIIAINATLLTLIAGLYAYFFKKELIIWWGGTCHSESDISIAKKYFRKLVFRFAKSFLVYSEFAKEYLIQLGVEHQKCFNIGNVSFDPQKFWRQIDAKKRQILPNRKVNLIAVGKYVERKNYSQLLQIYKQLKEEHRNINLTIVGDGKLKKSIVNQVRDENIQDVEFIGWINHEQMKDIYARGHIFIHLSLLDQWPQVVNEAFASKLPVVASEQSGISEYFFKNGEDVFITSLEQEEICFHIKRLINDSALRETLGENSFRKMKYVHRTMNERFNLILNAVDLSHPLISVIMSVYNGQEYLQSSIESLLGQKYKKFEIIIVDDGSTDHSLEIIRKFEKIDPRIKVIVNEKNIGLTRSLLKAVEVSTGEYIARQDADDVSHPNRLEWQMLYLERNPGISVCTGNVVYYYHDENRYRKREKKFLNLKLFLGNPIIHGSVMFRKKDYELVKGYDKFLKYAQDYDLWFKLKRLGNIGVINKFIYIQRIHSQSITAQKRLEQLFYTFKIQKRYLLEYFSRN